MMRLFGYYVSKVYLLLGLWEWVLFVASLWAGVFLRLQGFEFLTDSGGRTSVATTALVFGTVMSAALLAMGLYQRGAEEQASGFIVRLALSFAVGTLVISLVFYAFPPVWVGRGVLGYSLSIAFFGVLCTRAFFSHIVTADARRRRVLVLGAGINANRIAELVPESTYDGFVVVGYVPLGDRHKLIAEYQQIQKRGSLLDLAIERQVDEIVVAVDDRRRKLPVDEILDCKMNGFAVMDLLNFFEKERCCIKIDLLHPSWIFYSRGFHMGMLNTYGKRLLDVAVSAAMLIFLSPLMLIATIASLIESRGRDPIFFHQERVGEGGKTFLVHKFRSMRVDAEADGRARWASKDDPRVTSVGAFMRKYRIDELPQLFNVLVGEMSLVGPRPERPEFVKQLAASIPFYGERHRVKPGLTGWAQIMFFYAADMEDAKRKLEYDLYYVKHAGIILDLIILLQTAEIVFFGKGSR